jgi:catechol 2,3-dioxygenase-like lactoylglutathione lyase family enzyme
MPAVAWLHAFIDVPADLAGETERFWSEVTGWTPGRPWSGHPEFVSLEPPGASGYVHVQRIGGPPRLHLDLVADDIDAEAERLAGRGAQRGERHAWWQVMTSPGGLPFCLCGEPNRVRPAPTTWPTGHRSRVAQVCLDVPSAGFEAELAFWTEATGWEPEQARRPEYDRLRPPASSPLRLLVQRLGADDPGESSRAHLDIGTDDVAVEAARVEALGARLLRRTDRWIVFEDPAGLPFCVTPQPPD